MNKRQRKKQMDKERIKRVVVTPRKQLRNYRRSAWFDETFYMTIVAAQRFGKLLAKCIGRYPQEQ